MKAFVLIAQTASGELETLARSESAPVIKAAVDARESGKLAGKPIVAGVVLGLGFAHPLREFRCRPAPVKPAKK